MSSITDTLTNISNETAKMQYENRVTGTSELGQDAFLRLMMEQLKHQDPLNPMKNDEFLAQQAQFTQISELQKLNKAMSNSNQIMQASSLIGKTVSLTDPNDNTQIIEGKVTEAKINSTGASLVINGKEYPIDSILSIKDNQGEV